MTTGDREKLTWADYGRVAGAGCLGLVMVTLVFLLVVWGVDREHEWGATIDSVGDVAAPGR
jgi:hypothetical protein